MSQAEQIPFPARRAMQKVLSDALMHGENEWTTWSDGCLLAEMAAEALVDAGWTCVPMLASVSGEVVE